MSATIRVLRAFVVAPGDVIKSNTDLAPVPRSRGGMCVASVGAVITLADDFLAAQMIGCQKAEPWGEKTIARMRGNVLLIEEKPPLFSGRPPLRPSADPSGRPL
jgi:hypothetical protein